MDIAPTGGLDALSTAVKLPFRDDTFDIVLCTEVLEHVEDAEAAVGGVDGSRGYNYLRTVPSSSETTETARLGSLD